MIMAYQDIPINNTIELSKSIIVDQGIAVAALIFLFIIVVLFIAILWRVLGNQRQDNKGQGVLVGVVGNLVKTIDKFDKTANRFVDATETNDLQVSADRLAAHSTIQKNTESVDGMKAELERVIAEIELLRADFQRDMQQLIDTVNQSTSEIKNTVTATTSEYETRINQVELSVKELQPGTPVGPVTKLKQPGVPVTPKPINEELIEKLEEAKLKAQTKPKAEE